MERSWRPSVDRIVLGCVLFVVLVAFASTTAHPLVPAATGWLLLLAAAQLSFAALCVLGIRNGVDGRLRGAAIMTTVAGFAAATLAVGTSSLPAYAAHTLPANAVQAIQLSVIAFGVGTTAGVMTIVATGPVSVLVLVTGTDLSVWEAIDRWILPANASIAVLVVLAHLRAAAGRADDLAAESRRATRSALAASNAQLASDEARRLLHDEVITALRAIELELPAADVDADARRALSALATVPTPAADLGAALQADSRVRLTTCGAGWTSAPPPRIATAMRRAAAEAIRNVERHAGVDSAVVTVDQHGGSHRLRITDRGTGFDPREAVGFGISESIAGRMTSVGGSGTVESGPDGTTVHLVWPAVGDRPLPAIDQPTPARRVYLATIAAPGLANLYLAVRFPGASLAASLAVWAGLTCLLATIAVRLSRGTTGFAEPGLRTSSVLAAAACGYLLVGAGLAVAGDGSLLGAASWVVGYLSVGLAIAGFGAYLRATLASIAGLVLVVGCAAALDPTLATLAPVGALLTPVIVGGVGAVAGVAVRRAGVAIARGEALHRAQEEERTWRAGHERAQQMYLDHLDDDVVPFLTAVLDRSATAPAKTAAVLSAQCRDELHLAEPLPESTRGVARAARTRGVTLSIRSSAGGTAIPAVAWRALEVVLSGAEEEHVVTLLPPHRPGDPVRIVAVPPLLPGALAGTSTGDASSDDLRTVVLVWADPPTGTPRPRAVESLP